MKRSVADFIKNEWIFIVLLILVGGFSLYDLTEAPRTWYDEGMIMQLAQNLATYGTMGTQIAPGEFVSAAYTSTGYPLVAPIAGAFALFGESLAVARLVMVAFILLLFSASYVFVRRLAGRTYALAAAALLATFSTLYGDGKNVLGEVPGLFFFVMFAIYAHRIFDEGVITKKNAVLAGLFLGLCAATKPTFLVLGGAVCVGLIYAWIRKGATIPLHIAFLATGATLLPVLLWLITQFSLSDSPARVLSFYANPYLLQDFSQVMSHNALRFLTEQTPMYLLGMVAVWGAAVVVRLVRKERIPFVEVVAISFTGLILMAYLRTPGWYRYLFPAQIVSMIFFPVALMHYVRWLSAWRFARAARIGAVVLCAALIGLQTYVLLFSSWVGTYYGATTTAQMGQYFHGLNPDSIFFVYDIPEVVIFLPRGAPYYQYLSVNGSGYWEIGKEELAVISARIPDVLIIPSELAEGTTPLFPGYAKKTQIAGISVLERE